MSDNEYAVKFVRACSDKIGALVQFHDSPMPYFLFYMVRQRRPKSLSNAPRPVAANLRAHASLPPPAPGRCSLNSHPAPQNGEMVAKVEGPKMPELTKNMEAHAVKVA